MSSNTSNELLITGDGRTLTETDVAQVYRDAVNSSVPTDGRIQRLGDSLYSIQTHFSTVDCEILEKVQTFKIYSLQTKKINDKDLCVDSVRCVSDAYELNESASAVSNNGRFIAKIKESSSKKQLMQIWDRSRLLKTIDTSEFEPHGAINTEVTFSSFAWCPFGNQDKLLYVCQPKKPKHVSFFKDQPQSPDGKGLATKRGEEFVYRENWRECLTNVEHTLVAVLDVGDGFKVTTIDLEDYSLATPQWLDHGNKIVSAAYKETSTKLGIIYCNNRETKLVVHDLRSGKPEITFELKSTDDSFYSPRVNHASDQFIYLSNETYGVHKHSTKLHLYDLASGTSRRIVDDIHLFIDNLTRNCFTSDDKNILIETGDNMSTRMYLYNFEGKSLSSITFPTATSSLIDFEHDIILAAGCQINATPTVYTAVVNQPHKSDDVIAWHQLEDCIHLDEIEYETFRLPTQDSKSFVNAFIVRPNLKVLKENFINRSNDTGNLLNHHSQLPTVVMIHGGPHNHLGLNHRPWFVVLARLGLKSLVINYRGSTGISEDYIKALQGKIGLIDIEDCLHVIRTLVSTKELNPSKLILRGGSHGGFIIGHLTCQDEFKFNSAIIVNPVFDLISCMVTNDIPDWVTSEALGHNRFDFNYVCNKEDLARLYDQSVTSKLDKMVKTPTLMLLGDQDLRVNMKSQGLQWVNHLKARGVEVLCKIYPDSHQLSKVSSGVDSNISALLWILKHLPKL